MLSVRDNHGGRCGVPECPLARGGRQRGAGRAAPAPGSAPTAPAPARRSSRARAPSRRAATRPAARTRPRPAGHARRASAGGRTARRCCVRTDPGNAGLMGAAQMPRAPIGAARPRAVRGRGARLPDLRDVGAAAAEDAAGLRRAEHESGGCCGHDRAVPPRQLRRARARLSIACDQSAKRGAARRPGAGAGSAAHDMRIAGGMRGQAPRRGRACERGSARLGGSTTCGCPDALRARPSWPGAGLPRAEAGLPPRGCGGGAAPPAARACQRRSAWPSRRSAAATAAGAPSSAASSSPGAAADGRSRGGSAPSRSAAPASRAAAASLSPSRPTSARACAAAALCLHRAPRGPAGAASRARRLLMRA